MVSVAQFGPFSGRVLVALFSLEREQPGRISYWSYKVALDHCLLEIMATAANESMPSLAYLECVAVR